MTPEQMAREFIDDDARFLDLDEQMEVCKALTTLQQEKAALGRHMDDLITDLRTAEATTRRLTDEVMLAAEARDHHYAVLIETEARERRLRAALEEIRGLVVTSYTPYIADVVTRALAGLPEGTS